MFLSRNDWKIKLHVMVKFFFFFITTSKENVSVALPSVILASEGFLVNKQWWKLPSPHYYYCFKEKKLLLREKKVNDCGLVAQIYLDEKRSLKSFLSDCWICGKKTATDAKNHSVSSTLSLYRKRRVILKFHLSKVLKKNNR